MSELFKELPDIPPDIIMATNNGWKPFLKEHPGAINTAIGVLIDEGTNQPWRPHAMVSAVHQTLHELDADHTNNYQSQAGNPEYLQELGGLIFGEQKPDDLIAYQALGGTGALRLAAKTIEELVLPHTYNALALLLDDGWPNHPSIFKKPFQKWLEPQHLDPATGEYDHQAIMDAIDDSPRCVVLMLQASGYNDDGMDRTPAQWDEILAAAVDKKSVVVLDAAYLGLSEDWEKDSYAIRRAVQLGLLTFACVSNSKNLGLYPERVGAMYIANATKVLGEEEAKKLGPVISSVNVRPEYSSPPLHYAMAAAKALSDVRYHNELEVMRTNLQENRRIVGTMLENVFPQILKGTGLFTKLRADGFTPEELSQLEDADIWALPTSRVNLGGFSNAQAERVGETILRAVRPN